MFLVQTVGRQMVEQRQYRPSKPKKIVGRKVIISSSHRRTEHREGEGRRSFAPLFLSLSLPTLALPLLVVLVVGRMDKASKKRPAEANPAVVDSTKVV